jgi:hypothetical protein
MALARLPGAVIEDRAPRPGELDFHVLALPAELRERAIGMSAFLLEGIGALARDYPEAIAFNIEESRRE